MGNESGKGYTRRTNHAHIEYQLNKKHLKTCIGAEFSNKMSTAIQEMQRMLKRSSKTNVPGHHEMARRKKKGKESFSIFLKILKNLSLSFFLFLSISDIELVYKTTN